MTSQASRPGISAMSSTAAASGSPTMRPSRQRRARTARRRGGRPGCRRARGSLPARACPGSPRRSPARPRGTRARPRRRTGRHSKVDARAWPACPRRPAWRPAEGAETGGGRVALEVEQFGHAGHAAPGQVLAGLRVGRLVEHRLRQAVTPGRQVGQGRLHQLGGQRRSPPGRPSSRGPRPPPPCRPASASGARRRSDPPSRGHP